MIVDVRTTMEIRSTGKIQVEGRKWFQGSSASDDLGIDNLEQWDKGASVIVHCKSGKRAERAKQILEAKGFNNVLNGGGYSNAKEAIKGI